MPTLTEFMDEVKNLYHEMHNKVDELDKEQKKFGEDIASKTANVPKEVKSMIDGQNARINELMDLIDKTKVETAEKARIESQRPPLETRGRGLNNKNTWSPHHKAWIKAVRKQCDMNLVNEEERKLTVHSYMPAEQKDLYAGDATTGGFFAATDFINELLEYRLLISKIRQYCRVQETSGEKVQMPSLQSDASAYWAAEQASYTNSTDPTVNMITIPVHEARGLLRVSEQNLEDSQFDLEGLIKERLMLKFAQLEGKAFITGNGNGQPRGFKNYTIKATTSYTGGSAGKNNVTDAIPYVASGQAANITVDNIVNVMMDLKSDYESVAAYAFTRGTLNTIRLFKDSVGRPLWQPFAGANLPGTIYGRPYVEMPDMDEIAANTYPILVGDFKQYMIVDRVTLNIRRLEELYAAQGLVGFIARMRLGGDVLIPEAFRWLKVATS